MTYYLFLNNLNSENTPSDVCCFHAQQTAEKYMKAYLVAKSITFPKTHDLRLLIHLCEQKNHHFASILTTPQKLVPYSVFARYPDLEDDLTVADARNAYEDAITIKNFVLKHFFD